MAVADTGGLIVLMRQASVPGGPGEAMRLFERAHLCPPSFLHDFDGRGAISRLRLRLQRIGKIVHKKKSLKQIVSTDPEVALSACMLNTGAYLGHGSRNSRPLFGGL